MCFGRHLTSLTSHELEADRPASLHAKLLNATSGVVSVHCTTRLRHEGLVIVQLWDVLSHSVLHMRGCVGAITWGASQV